MVRRLCVLLLLLEVAACSHSPLAFPPEGAISPKDFWRDQAERGGATTPISAKLWLRFRSKQQNLSGKGRLVGDLPERLRLDLRDPLGRLAYAVALDGERLTAYYPTQKKAFLDEKAGGMYLRRMMGLEVSFRDLQEVFVGRVPGVTEKFDRWEWDPRKGLFRGRARANEKELVVWVDALRATVREMQILLPTETVQVTYADFEPCCTGKARPASRRRSISLARTVTMALSMSGNGIEMEWQEFLQLPRAPAPEAFQIVVSEDTQKSVLK